MTPRNQATPVTFFIFRGIITLIVASTVTLFVLGLVGAGPAAPWLAKPAAFLQLTVDYWAGIASS